MSLVETMHLPSGRRDVAGGKTGDKFGVLQTTLGNPGEVVRLVQTGDLYVKNEMTEGWRRLDPSDPKDREAFYQARTSH